MTNVASNVVVANEVANGVNAGFNLEAHVRKFPHHGRVVELFNDYFGTHNNSDDEVYHMSDLDELFHYKTTSECVSQTKELDTNHPYFIATIWGLKSFNSVLSLYEEHLQYFESEFLEWATEQGYDLNEELA